MNKNEQVYLDLLNKVLTEGKFKCDRTNTGTYSIFGYQMRFDLAENFPLLTTKRVPFKLIASELLWFLRGDTNIRFLLKNNNHIWDEWAFKNYVESVDYSGPDMTNFGNRSLIDKKFKLQYENELDTFCNRILVDADFAAKYGELGPVYGKQWRNWETMSGTTIDQLAQVVDQIKINPDSRRLIVSAWNPVDVPSMALPPCHTMFQFYVADNKLSCQLYQRSGDIFLGIPFNIASYCLLTHLIANICGLQVGEFIHTLGDAHLYQNHVEQAKTQLMRDVVEGPQLIINRDSDVNDLFGFKMEDLRVINYNPQSAIKAPVAV